jgi:hypothetical protein
MLKIVKIYSVVALATLVMIGCGASDDGGKSPEKKPPIGGGKKGISQYNDAEKLACALVKQRKALKFGKNDDKNDDKKKRAFDQSCKNGGVMDFGNIDIGGFQRFDEINFNKPMILTFKKCDDGYGILNGTINMDLDDNDDGTIEYVTDFSFEDENDRGVIKKGGRVDMYHDGEWEVATINMIMNVNGITHGGEDLVYRSKELPDGVYLEYPVSGREKIGDSAYFEVDPAYDAGQTPFKSDKNDILKSGKFRYIDAQEHAVELEVTGDDIVTVRVDEDGDGEFKDREISSINLAN